MKNESGNSTKSRDICLVLIKCRNFRNDIVDVCEKNEENNIDMPEKKSAASMAQYI